jgi:DnaJ-class molecular chaperone
LAAGDLPKRESHALIAREWVNVSRRKTSAFLRDHRCYDSLDKAILRVCRCKKCKGNRTTKEKKAVDLVVERGMMHNQKIVLKGEGDQQVYRYLIEIESYT